MPHYVLRETLVYVHVDEGLADADALDSAKNSGLDNLEPRRIGQAAYVRGLTPRVGGVSAPALCQVPGLRPEGAVQDKRDACRLSDIVEDLEEGGIHIVYLAGGRAAHELRRLEILTHTSLNFSASSSLTSASE